MKKLGLNNEFTGNFKIIFFYLTNIEVFQAHTSHFKYSKTFNNIFFHKNISGFGIVFFIFHIEIITYRQIFIRNFIYFGRLKIYVAIFKNFKKNNKIQKKKGIQLKCTTKRNITIEQKLLNVLKIYNF